MGLAFIFWAYYFNESIDNFANQTLFFKFDYTIIRKSPNSSLEIRTNL